MTEPKKYDNFPLWIVLLSNTVSVLISGLGFMILIRIHWIFAILYLIYILILEYRLIKNHCVNCYYWGKNCGFGKGKLSSWFFKKGDVSRFYSNNMTWKSIIPDLLVPVIPIITGIVLIIIKFDYLILILLILILFLSATGNGLIRGKLTCKYCNQKELGCPADKLLNK